MSKKLSGQQKMFNKVVRNLRRQGQASRNDQTCFYRLGKLRCGIGWVIPNHIYHKGMEGTSITLLVRASQKLYEYIGKTYGNDTTEGFMQELQSIHDNGLTYGMSYFEDRVVMFANKFNLKIPSKK